MNVKANSRIITSARPMLNQKVEKQPSHTEVIPTSDNELIRTNTADLKESNANTDKQPTNSVGSVAERIKPEKRSDKSPTRLSTDALSKTETDALAGTESATKRPASAYGLKTERTKSSRSKPGKSVVAGRNNVAETVASRSVKTKLRVNRVSRKERKATAIEGDRKANVATNYAAESNLSAVSTGKRSKRRGSSDQASKQTNVVERGRSTSPANAINMSGSTTPTETIETGLINLPALAELAARPAKWPKLSFTNRAVTVQPDTTARSVVFKPDPQRGLSIRFAVAPDLSTVGLDNFTRPGTNVGLLLEYRLASRWSIQAGLIQSTKVYRSYPSEYTPPPGAWGGKVMPGSVDGLCNMFDIPVNLRYDVLLRPQTDKRFMSRWFVSGGVTSYIMKQEKYIYNYTSYAHNQRTDSTASTGGYGFSNVNFSVGYERSVSKRLSWQVEPFIKVPLRGVGLFRVNLISTGAFFSIRYKLFN